MYKTNELEIDSDWWFDIAIHGGSFKELILSSSAQKEFNPNIQF